MPHLLGRPCRAPTGIYEQDFDLLDQILVSFEWVRGRRGGEHPVRRVGRFVDFRVLNDHLDGGAPVLRGSVGIPRRQALGTDGCVFLWLGAAAYEVPAFVLFVDAVCEDDPAVELSAAPWDTGGLVGKGVLGRPVTEGGAKHYVDRYTLPKPHHRTHLACVLDVCFEDPLDYVHGCPPRGCYPGHQDAARRPERPAQTYEARVAHHLELEGRVISVVFDPACIAGSTPRQTRLRRQGLERWCRSGGVRMVQPSSAMGSTVRGAIVGEVERILEERSVL